MGNAILDNWGLCAIALYLLMLMLLGWLAKRMQKEDSLKDYYLAGGSLGSMALFFTLYATQYSGNSLLGAPGEAYRNGFAPIGVAAGMMGIILVYRLFAPKLNVLAKRHDFVTLGDFVRWRFNHSGLVVLVNLLILMALTSYGLANFKAVGLLLETVSGGKISFTFAAIALAIVMGFYETMGGMRAVVWTDILQGLLLLAGSALVFSALYQVSGGTGVLSVSGFTQEFSSYIGTDLHLTGFISLILLVSFSAAMYPQALQRIYASRNVRTLKKAYRVMFFMPLLTVLPMILVGVAAKDLLPDLSVAETDRVVIHLINHIAELYPALSWLLILYICALIAAIMSTIDSASLALGSTLMSDVLNHDNSMGKKELLQESRVISWTLMAMMAFLAIALPQSIWALMIFKLELLIQIAPIIILGTRTRAVEGPALFYGAIAGSIVAVFLKATGMDLPLLGGVHAGIIGVLVNLALVFGTTLYLRSPRTRTISPCS